MDGNTPILFFSPNTPPGLGPFVTIGICLGLAWPAVILRFYTRTRIVKALGVDDWCMALALISFTGFCGCTLQFFRIVGDKSSLTFQESITAVDLYTATQCLYTTTMILLKISLGIFFIRIVPHQWQRRLIRCTVATTTTYGLVCLFYSIFQCGLPIGGAIGIQRQLTGKCTTTTTMLAMAYSHGVMTSITDLIFAFIPISVLRQTQMDRRNKTIIYLVLCLGTLGGVASFVRLPYLSQVAPTNAKFILYCQNVFITSTIEPALGITASSLATLRKLFTCLKQRVSQYHNSRKPADTESQQQIWSHEHEWSNKSAVLEIEDRHSPRFWMTTDRKF